jgi:hypothetical protein
MEDTIEYVNLPGGMTVTKKKFNELLHQAETIYKQQLTAKKLQKQPKQKSVRFKRDHRGSIVRFIQNSHFVNALLLAGSAVGARCAFVNAPPIMNNAVVLISAIMLASCAARVYAFLSHWMRIKPCVHQAITKKPCPSQRWSSGRIPVMHETILGDGTSCHVCDAHKDVVLQIKLKAAHHQNVAVAAENSVLSFGGHADNHGSTIHDNEEDDNGGEEVADSERQDE